MTHFEPSILNYIWEKKIQIHKYIHNIKLHDLIKIKLEPELHNLSSSLKLILI